MIKEKVKTLWKLCFNDSEEYVDMYFRLRYNNNVNIALQTEDELAAALQMLPYPMTFCGKTIQTSYISGACTHPDYRGKGAMRELLSQAFTRMLQNKMLLSTLIPAEPWLFDYYARMGYVPIFRYSTKILLESDFKHCLKLTTEVNKTSAYNENVYQYLNRKMHERPCCIQHTKKDFHVILADASVGTSCLYVATQHNEITGIAITNTPEEHLLINELFTENKESEEALIHFILQNNNRNNALLITPPINDSSQTLGMARIINAKAILKLYAAQHPKFEIGIELTDSQLEANNSFYYLHNGQCIQSKQRLQEVQYKFNISELCKWIFASPLQPYMSLMLN